MKRPAGRVHHGHLSPTQPFTQVGINEQCSCFRLALVRHQDPRLDDPREPVEDARVAVGDVVGDIAARQQAFDHRQQDGIVRADRSDMSTNSSPVRGSHVRAQPVVTRQ